MVTKVLPPARWLTWFFYAVVALWAALSSIVP
jgi:hypothetical protein